LRVIHLHGQQVATSIPDIVSGKFYAPWQQVSGTAKLANSFKQPLAKPIDMGAALRGRYQVNVALGHQFVIIEQPVYRPVYRLVMATHGAEEWLLRQ